MPKNLFISLNNITTGFPQDLESLESLECHGIFFSSGKPEKSGNLLQISGIYEKKSYKQKKTISDNPKEYIQTFIGYALIYAKHCNTLGHPLFPEVEKLGWRALKT